MISSSVDSFMSEMENDQPQIWDTNDFVSFLRKTDLGSIADHFSTLFLLFLLIYVKLALYYFQWDIFLEESEEMLTEFTHDSSKTRVLLQCKPTSSSNNVI